MAPRAPYQQHYSGSHCQWDLGLAVGSLILWLCGDILPGVLTPAHFLILALHLSQPFFEWLPVLSLNLLSAYYQLKPISVAYQQKPRTNTTLPPEKAA